MTLRAPTDMPECRGLPVRYDRDAEQFISLWHLTFWQKVRLLFGARLWVVVYSRAHPPIALTVIRKMFTHVPPK